MKILGSLRPVLMSLGATMRLSKRCHFADTGGVFEPACSIGVLTEPLATICDRIDAIDISAKAVEQAVQRCRLLANVIIKQGALPAETPAGPFDLIVFSEVGYYFEKPQLRALIDQLMGSLESEGIFLAAHWLGTSPDHILNGNEVHEIVFSTKGLIHDHTEHHPGVSA